MTSEAARLQGFHLRLLRRNNKEPQNHFMLGNAISVPVLQRIIITAIRTIGFEIEDPWRLGTAQQHLIQAAKADQIPPNFRMTRSATINNITQAHKLTPRIPQGRQVTLLRYYHQRTQTPIPTRTDNPSPSLPNPPCFNNLPFAEITTSNTANQPTTHTAQPDQQSHKKQRPWNTFFRHNEQ